jgi:hypothetical protein
VIFWIFFAISVVLGFGPVLAELVADMIRTIREAMRDE